MAASIRIVLGQFGIDREDEYGALVFRGFHPDIPAHHLNQRLADGKSQPRTAILPGHRGIQLGERLEQTVTLLR
ncbi:hypothetical protein D3C73_1620040 [compost metagenome]